MWLFKISFMMDKIGAKIHFSFNVWHCEKTNWMCVMTARNIIEEGWENQNNVGEYKTN